MKSMKGNPHFDAIMAEIQNLEEIGGPDTLQDWLDVVDAVLLELNERREVCVTALEDEKADA